MSLESATAEKSPEDNLSWLSPCKGNIASFVCPLAGLSQGGCWEHVCVVAILTFKLP